MHKLLRIVLLLTFALVTAGFGACGKAVSRPDVCPVLSPVPPSLTQRTDYVKPVQDELLEPSEPAKPSGID